MVLLATEPARAAGSNILEQPLNQILQSVEGPVAKIIAVIIIVVTGLTARVRGFVRWFPPVDPDRVRSVDRIRGLELLSVVLLLWRRRGDLMDDPVAGFVVPVHRALTEPILMGGAPRSVAIVNGTLAAALGLGLPAVDCGSRPWFIGHMAAVWATKRDPAFVDVVADICAFPGHLNL